MDLPSGDTASSPFVARCERFAELYGDRFPIRSMQTVEFPARKLPGLPSRPNARTKERLVCINVPNTMQQFLIE